MLSSLLPWGTAALNLAGEAAADAAARLSKTPSFASMLQPFEASTERETEPTANALETLHQQVEAKRAELRQSIAARLTAAGIPLKEPLALEVDAFGELRVAPPGHAQSSRIEMLLAEDRGIRQQFEQLQELRTHGERLELVARAEQLHTLDPHAAANLKRHALRHEAAPLQLSVGG